MRCDMCGSDKQLYKTDIEGAEMEVCKPCSEHGKVISRIEKKKPEKKTPKKKEEKKPEKIRVIRKDYSSVIKEKREKKELEQSELAREIGEKESVIHQLETGHMEPSLEVARKLEKFLGIELVQEHEEKPMQKEKKELPEMTVGDMVQIE